MAVWLLSSTQAPLKPRFSTIIIVVSKVAGVSQGVAQVEVAQAEGSQVKSSQVKGIHVKGTQVGPHQTDLHPRSQKQYNEPVVKLGKARLHSHSLRPDA